MARTRQQALALALSDVGTTYPPRWCLQRVRLWLDIASLYQDSWDHDGRNEAMDAWIGATRRHPGDRRPPGGVPGFFEGGGSGHVCLTVGQGEDVITTDWPRGRVGRATIRQIETTWGRSYVGWSEDLNGVLIPDDPPLFIRDEEDVYVDAALMIRLAYKCELGRTPSDLEVYPRLSRVLHASDPKKQAMWEVDNVQESPEAQRYRAKH